MVHTPHTLPAPSELVKHRAKWTVRYQSIASGSSTGEWATQSARKVLAGALRGMAHGKCVYCESLLGLTTYQEIEHYVAKTVTPALAFEWTNLLPACRLCNNAKGEQDHQGALLKPDAKDPEPYFWVHPDTGKLEPHPKLDAAQSYRATETIRICDLQRPALCTKRVEMLMRVLRAVDSQWEELCAPHTEYKLVLRHVLELRNRHALAEYDRQSFRSATI